MAKPSKKLKQLREASPEARIFVVEIKDKDELIGYAITEQVGFINLSDHNLLPDVEMEARLFREGFTTLFGKLCEKTHRAIGIPARRDPQGGGYMMFTSASNGTSAN